ncbi:hypothetical protein PHISP_04418 [Aspergillus sp. HF37]|nr:hypothetical protein PHISP_04418 [Aspergillus sp. HF37]
MSFADCPDTPRPGPESLSFSALARFEFEPGRSNDGTKILMVEWEDDDDASWAGTGSRAGAWRVEWEGKRAVLPADEHDNSDATSTTSTRKSTRRVYFLLPPNVGIPPVVSLAYEPSGTGNPVSTAETHSLHLNPLPAIFPPELGSAAVAAGRKGVLHTVWAKKRLQSLEREIRDECRSNVEGIALQMALQEREWIAVNFGVSSSGAGYGDPAAPFTPVSPSSSGKLAQKLKGLRLRTAEGDLSPTLPTSNHLLSPQSPDMAVSSFTSFHSLQPSRPSQPSHHVKPVPQYPPEPSHPPPHPQPEFAGLSSLARSSSADSGEELFAKALSPRSPDLPRSPFSFA